MFLKAVSTHEWSITDRLGESYRAINKTLLNYEHSALLEEEEEEEEEEEQEEEQEQEQEQEQEVHRTPRQAKAVICQVIGCESLEANRKCVVSSRWSIVTNYSLSRKVAELLSLKD